MCKTVIFVGTYTQPIRFGTGEVLQGHGKGIYCYVLKDDQMVECTVAQTVNASFLTMDHKQRHLYATNELKEYQGLPGGAVSAFRFDPQTMEIQYLNTQPVGGADPCHVEMDSEDEHLYCANFMSGSVTVLPIKRDGSLDEQSCLIQHQGSSVNPIRQQGPHAHGIFFAPDNTLLYVPDLGMDRIVCYRPTKAGELVPQPDKDIPSPAPGLGPRHMVFHPSGDYFYVNTEMGSTVHAYRYNRGTGKATLIQSLSTLPHGENGEQSTTAAIKLHPNGRLLYVSNRGHDSLATYRVDQQKGLLTLLAIQPTGGRIPRDFAFTPDGKYLIAAHQSSDDVCLFRVNAESGALTLVERIEVPTPICVRCYTFA